MQNPFKDNEKDKTIAEHATIIINYKKTSLLDRQYAIEKYKEFNRKYPDFNIQQTNANLITNNIIRIDDASNDVIVGNLYSQLLWLAGLDYLKAFCV